MGEVFTVEALPLFRRTGRGLEQIVRVGLEKGTARPVAAVRFTLVVPALDAPATAEAVLEIGGRRIARRVSLQPRRRWEIHDEEILIRSLYYAFAFARACGATIRTAMASDSTGQPWLFPQVFARAGVRYFSTSVNATRGKAPRLPRPFRWQSRDGSRILVLDTDERQDRVHGGRHGARRFPQGAPRRRVRGPVPRLRRADIPRVRPVR
jgi:hypothetical protein